MKEHRSEFLVRRMASALKVTQSGFYAWLNRPESPRKRERQRFDVEVRAIFEASDHPYGSEKIAKALSERGYHHNRKRVADA